MNNSRLLQLLRSFEESELKKLHEFIISPYHNKHTDVIGLFNYIYNTGFDNPKQLQKNVVFKALFPKEAYNDLKLRHIMSYLYQIIENFIAHQELKLNTTNKQIEILKSYRKKNATRLFELTERKILNKKTGGIKSTSLYSNYLLAQEIQAYYAGKKRTESSYINNLHTELDLFYFVEKMKISCSSANLEKLYNQQISIPFLESVLLYIEQHEIYKQNPLLAIYFYAYKLLSASKECSFLELKHQVENATGKVAIEEIKPAFQLMINHSIQQLNKGENRFLQELFSLYQFGVYSEILMQGKQLPYVTYSNIATVGLRLKKYNATRKFIEEKKEFLPIKFKEDCYIFNLSKYFFEINEYERVTEFYFQYKMKEILLNVQSRIIQIKAFYELSEFELCHSLNDNLKQLLTRKGILAYHKENYKNVAKYFKRLLNVNPYDKKGIRKLISIVESINPLTEKTWIVEKLKEL